MTNSMAYVATLFLASFSFCLNKKLVLRKCMGFVVNSFFLQRFGKFFAFLQKFQFFSICCAYLMCLHFSFVFFPFTSHSTAFEKFSRWIFGLFVLNFFVFSNIKCTNLRSRIQSKRLIYGDITFSIGCSLNLIEKSYDLNQEIFDILVNFSNFLIFLKKYLAKSEIKGLKIYKKLVLRVLPAQRAMP